MQAAYCVGGHWFNASVIESCILKGKAMAHRPQFGLMMALQKNKLKEELIKYGINHLEPLVNFALCCGAQFSPMVSTSPLRIIMFLVFGFRSIFICLFSFSSLKFQWNGFYFFHN
jgi:hypothetical protein